MASAPTWAPISAAASWIILPSTGSPTGKAPGSPLPLMRWCWASSFRWASDTVISASIPPHHCHMDKYFFLLLVAALLTMPQPGSAQTRPSQPAEPASRPDDYDVSWNTPGPNSAASMPLGNGDIGLNVWVEPEGDVLFYISKTDAWGGEKDSTMDEWMQ